MSCKIEVSKTINISIAKFLPNRDEVMSEGKADRIVKSLNELWGPVALKKQFTSEGGFKVGIVKLSQAVDIEFNKQEAAEKEFERDLDFFKGDEALLDQEDKQDSFLQKKGTTISSKASPKTIAAVKDFLKRIGVDVQTLQEIVVKGVKQDASGVAFTMQNLIQVVDGMEETALTEEAMHFAVEILEQTNPKLFTQLLKDINDYQILQEVMRDYGTDINYQTKEGKPNIRKLKKEAIAKVLTETIIFQNEGRIEKPELLAKTESWWNQIIDFIRGLFIKNGFDKAARDILVGKDIGTTLDLFEGDTYLQKTEDPNSEQTRLFNIFKDPQAILNEEDNTYYAGVKKVGRRVSDLVKDWYERRFTNNALTKTDFQQSIDDLKAEKGTAGHADIEHAFKMLVDEETGLIREEEIEDENYVSLLNNKDDSMYLLLKDNLRQRLRSFPKGTKFMSEAVIYDARRDIAGTVDFLAITPEGKVSILDWKFMDLNTDRYTDIPWYKINAWNTQMEQYKYIISRAYGVKHENFEQTRMIPIKAIYSDANRKANVLPRLLNIKIGDIVIKNITDDYLIPVGLESEKTGNKKIDSLLEKLNAIYEKTSKQRVTTKEKANKAEQLNALFSAIRQLQMRGNIIPLLHQAKLLNKQIKKIIETYEKEYKGKDKTIFSEKELSDFAETLELAGESLLTYTNLNTELRFLFQGELSEEDKKLKEDLRDTVDEAQELADVLKDIDSEYITTMIGGTLSPEKIIRGIGKMFGTTATLQLKALDTLYKKANKAFGFATMDTLTEVKRLTAIKTAYQKWAQAKGLTIINQFDIIKKKDKNELIDEFNPEFYSTLKEKIEDKDFKWVMDNIDKPAYIKHIKEKKEEEHKRIDEKPRVGTAPQIKQEILREKVKINSLYDVSTAEAVGWLLYDNVKLFPKREVWESKEWKELNKPANKPALAFYEYIRERNDYYRSIEYIHAKQARVFLPWVRQGFTEKFIFNGKATIGEQFLRSISVDEGDIGYGNIDPLTGKPKDSIPKYLTHKIEGNVSTDLFKTMAMYNEFAIKFKYLSDIEAQARALLRLEKNKKAIATSFFGKTEYNEGVFKTNPDNSENTKLLESMVKAIIYQQRYIESESFDQLLGTFGKTAEKINKKLGFKLFPEDLENRQLSVNKLITQLNTTFQLTALGLNTLSATSNLFGGKSQSLINAGKYYTKSDYVSTELWLLANKMGGENKKKMLAALDFFVPFTENYNRDADRDLSINKLNDQGIQDFLMILMRKGDRAVQTTNFFTFIKNSIVQDDKVVNTREYLRTLPEYQEFYAGTQIERKERAAKFEKDVIRLNEEQGVLNVGVVKDGKFVLPNVEQKSQSVIEIRRTIQQVTADALGNMTEENKRLLNLTVYGSSFMVFKNWIPRLVDVRMGGLKYNSASDAYEWGRTRMVFKIITEDLLGSIANLTNSLKGNDKGMAYARELYERKKYEYEIDTNKTLEMTETEFIRLVNQNIENQLLDVLFYASLFIIFAGLKALAPDEDEDPAVRNQYKFIMKMTDKFKDEIGYFYNPGSFSGVISSGIFPSFSLLTNYTKAIKRFAIENYALVMGDKELQESNDVIKYWMKSFPVSNQAAGLLPMFAPNVAKDLGLKMQGEYNRK